MKRFAARQWLILFALVSLTGAAVFGQQISPRHLRKSIPPRSRIKKIKKTAPASFLPA